MRRRMSTASLSEASRRISTLSSYASFLPRKSPYLCCTDRGSVVLYRQSVFRDAHSLQGSFPLHYEQVSYCTWKQERSVKEYLCFTYSARIASSGSSYAFRDNARLLTSPRWGWLELAKGLAS